jgi:flagellar basal-body rod modification protein FlgD
MSQIPSAFGAANPSSQTFGSANTLNDLDLDDFLDLMIAELQNQDPLNPLENDELVAQISQIREVGATDRLTETLDAVLLGQNISSATNLIGTQVEAMSDDLQRVNGLVERISVANGRPKLHLSLQPGASTTSTAGAIEPGEYEYRVVWEQDGNLFEVDPLAGREGNRIAVAGAEGGQPSVMISNLPQSRSLKQVYRRNAGEGGNFRLAGLISDGNQATFLDTKSNSQLSETVLTGNPQRISAVRNFEVSLNNVSEIRPSQH